MSQFWVSDDIDDDEDINDVTSDDTERHVRDIAEMAPWHNTVSGSHISGCDHVYSVHPSPDGHQLRQVHGHCQSAPKI